MSISLVLRHGSSDEHNNFIGALGEVTVNTDTNTLHIHDGLTLGGQKISGAINWKEIASNYTMKINEGLFLDTSLSSFEIVLPSITESSIGDELYAFILNSTNLVSILSNDAPINGLYTAEMMTEENKLYTFTYIGGTQGWVSTESLPVPDGSRGIFFGGFESVELSDIDFITIPTQGSASIFGSLLQPVSETYAVSNGSRGVAIGGNSSGSITINTLQFVTFATLGNSSNLGSLTSVLYDMGAVADGNKAVLGGGKIGVLGDFTSLLQTFQIDTFTAATAHGNLSSARSEVAGLSGGDRGIFVSGKTPTKQSVIDYISIGLGGNATIFGNLTTTLTATGATSDGSRGVVFGGRTSVSTIQYITIAVPSIAQLFGNLANTRYDCAATSFLSRAVVGGGWTGDSGTSSLEYIDITTLADAKAFGNLTGVSSLSSVSIPG